MLEENQLTYLAFRIGKIIEINLWRILGTLLHGKIIRNKISYCRDD